MDNIIQEPAVEYPRRCTTQEYLAMEWEDGVRYEYWEGELVAMSFATKAYNRITFNINKSFLAKKEKDKSGSFQDGIMVRPQNKQIYFLPDVVFTCHPDDLDLQGYEVKYPTIIVEVLSESTEIYDRVRKWEQYRKLPSLRHYLLVSQHSYRVEIFSRTHEHALFYYQCFDTLDEVIAFPEFEFEMGMKEVYDGIEIKEDVGG